MSDRIHYADPSEDDEDFEVSDDKIKSYLSRKSSNFIVPLSKSSDSSDESSESNSEYDNVVVDESSRFLVGVADTQGKRGSMEDAMLVSGQFRDNNDEDLFGVFDGHGGPRAAIRASNEIGDQLEERLDELSENGELDEQAIRQALIDAFRMTHEKIIVDLESGTTA